MKPNQASPEQAEAVLLIQAVKSILHGLDDTPTNVLHLVLDELDTLASHPAYGFSQTEYSEAPRLLGHITRAVESTIADLHGVDPRPWVDSYASDDDDEAAQAALYGAAVDPGEAPTSLQPSVDLRKDRNALLFRVATCGLDISEKDCVRCYAELDASGFANVAHRSAFECVEELAIQFCLGFNDPEALSDEGWELLINEVVLALEADSENPDVSDDKLLRRKACAMRLVECLPLETSLQHYSALKAARRFYLV